MFILRTVEDYGKKPCLTVKQNHMLGDFYEAIDCFHPSFEKYFNEYELKGDPFESKAIFLSCQKHDKPLTLFGFENMSYYIMTESGKTFEKL